MSTNVYLNSFSSSRKIVVNISIYIYIHNVNDGTFVPFLSLSFDFVYGAIPSAIWCVRVESI